MHAAIVGIGAEEEREVEEEEEEEEKEIKGRKEERLEGKRDKGENPRSEGR